VALISDTALVSRPEDRADRRSVVCAPGVRHPGGGYLALPKRVLDIAGAIALLPAAAVIVAAAAVAIRLTSPGPALYRQLRVGRGGRVFTLLKLRTMVDGAEAETGPVWAAPDDPRLTPAGGVLRRFHIDELPQLWNVLRGEMSLIGPRPERPHFVRRLRGVLRDYDDRLSVRPGITGWAQIHRGPDTCIADAAEKLRYDLEYVRRASPGLDARIALETLRTVLIGH